MAEKTDKLNLRLKPQDKRFIKVYCAEHDKTAADLFEEFLQQLQEKSLSQVN